MERGGRQAVVRDGRRAAQRVTDVAAGGLVLRVAVRRGNAVLGPVVQTAGAGLATVGPVLSAAG
ncbi:hypothetical protein [Streptomyces marokkonensis]|uniref:hypothetical protein n=1 Tax=Streptomyces marokkonensis TaxID=324855 RepID=UPI0011F1BD35|nr:hypothetical protein [Streptomyces marokkonensis]